MLARLTIYQTDRPVRQLMLEPDRSYLIGRDAACAICLADDGVSRRHARLACAGHTWRLADLCSKNGTLIDGKPIGECELTDSRWIEFGAVLACFERVPASLVERERQRLAARRETSIEMSRTMQPGLDAEELLRRILDSFVELSGAERGFVMLTEADGAVRASASHPDSELDFDGSRSVVDRVLRENAPVISSDAGADAGLKAQASIAAGRISALACVPLRVGTHLLGVIYVDSRRPGARFTEQEVEILQALADHASLVIGVARLRRSIVDLSGMLPAELDPAVPPSPSLLEKLTRYLPGAAGEPGRMHTFGRTGESA